MAKRKIAKKPAQKKKRPGRPKASTRPPSLTSLRRRIDRLDREIVERINERADLAHSIGKIKDAAGSVVYAPGREEEVLSSAVEVSQGPLSEQCIRAIFREIISGSRAIEKMLRVAFLGPLYSYSHLAAIHRFGQISNHILSNGIHMVFLPYVSFDGPSNGLIWYKS